MANTGPLFRNSPLIISENSNIIKDVLLARSQQLKQEYDSKHKRYRLVFVCEPPLYWQGIADEREFTDKNNALRAAEEWNLQNITHAKVKVEDFYR